VQANGDKLAEHLVRNNIGFVPGKSCSSNLLETLEIITQIIDNRRPVDVIFMDFAKAFDSVPHRRLLLKVKQYEYGIRGTILAWVKDFLQGRTQFVSVGTGNSNNSNVLSGVPQGSVLGPILFVIYIYIYRKEC
jgi:hypothetical protein